MFSSRDNYIKPILCAVVMAALLPLASCTDSIPHPENIAKAPTYVNDKLHQIGELPPYKIQIGDVIEVKFLYNEEFNQEIVVRPDGRISTAAVQSIKAFGKTPQQLSKELTEQYQVHLKEPHLSVLIKSYQPTKIYLLGEVRNPGEYEYVTPYPTLMSVISKAGDVLDSGKAEQILIVRKNEVEQPTFYLASYEDVARGLDAMADVQLASNDVVLVPKTRIANAYEAYNQYIRQFIRVNVGDDLTLNAN